jgi:hypothetical protein
MGAQRRRWDSAPMTTNLLHLAHAEAVRADRIRIARRRRRFI